MNDAGTRKSGELWRVMQQSVQQRTVAVAAARMDNQPRRFVDNDNRLVLVNDGNLDRLRRIRNGECVLHCLDDDPLTAGKPSFALGDLAIERDGPGVNPVLEATAGMLRNQPRERLVEAQPGEVGRNSQLERSRDSVIADRSVRSAIIRATHEGWHR